MQAIIESLDRLAEFQAQRDVMNLDKQAAIDSVLTPEIRVRIVDIEAEFDDKAQAVVSNIAALETEIKVAVVAHGETVKGSLLMAVWNKGRASWDDKALQGYMKAHPELADFRKQGDPSISIRANSK